MPGIDEAPCESTPIQLPADHYVRRSHAEFLMIVADNDAIVTAFLRRDFLDNEPLEVLHVLVAVAEDDFPHLDLAMPRPAYGSVKDILD